MSLPLKNQTDSKRGSAKKGTHFDMAAEMKKSGTTPLIYDNNESATDVVKRVAAKMGVNQSLLFSSAWQEGLNKAALQPDNVSAGYNEAKVPGEYPVDGFLNYGLDTIGDRYKQLMKYLPEGFEKNLFFYKTTNEKNEPVTTAAFKNNEDAITAKAAFMKLEGDNINAYADSKKIPLDDESKGYFMLAAYNCFDDQTEVLTHNGFRLFKDVEKDDLIGSFDMVTSEIKYDNFLNYYCYDYKGDMIVTKASSNFKVTPNHKMVVKKSGQAERPVHLEYAERCLTANWLFPVSGKSYNNDYKLSDAQIKMTAWILTDASIGKKSKKGQNVVLYQREEKMHLITNILDELGYGYNARSVQLNTTHICGKELKSTPKPIYHIQLSAAARDKMFEYISIKTTIPAWVENLSQRQFELFLESYIDGDGSRHPRCVTYRQIDGRPGKIDELQILCCKFGYKTRVISRTENCKRLQILKNDWAKLPLTTEYYEGNVYCLETNLGTLVTRRKGHIIITGNSGLGNAVKMMDEYVQAQDKKKFIANGETSLKGVHKNIKVRLDNMVTANELLK